MIKKAKPADRQTNDTERGAVKATSRRAFLGKAMGIGGVVGLASALVSSKSMAGEKPHSEVAVTLDHPQTFPDGNPLERMRKELRYALQKPVEQRKWVMVIDQEKCVGCKACTVTCVAENALPPGVVYRPVVEQEVGSYPDVRKRFIPRPCMQCDKPPCVPVCPVSATYQRPDGTVAIDYDICIGCRYCLAACPYNARTSDFGGFFSADTDDAGGAMTGPEVAAYETRPNFEYGREWKREPHGEESPIGNARKCQFCLHRVENGVLPACVTTCLGGATYFGDYRDPNSLVHELVGTSRMMQLKEELGTEPSVFYLV